MDINWTTIIASCLTAVIVGGSQFIANRYLAKILDRIEREMKSGKGNGNGKDKPKTEGTNKRSVPPIPPNVL